MEPAESTPLLPLLVDLVMRAYGNGAGRFHHAFEATGQEAAELLVRLGVATPVPGTTAEFYVRPRADWP